jgi:hypothetical protein
VVSQVAGSRKSGMVLGSRPQSALQFTSTSEHEHRVHGRPWTRRRGREDGAAKRKKPFPRHCGGGGEEIPVRMHTMRNGAAETRAAAGYPAGWHRLPISSVTREGEGAGEGDGEFRGCGRQLFPVGTMVGGSKFRRWPAHSSASRPQPFKLVSLSSADRGLTVGRETWRPAPCVACRGCQGPGQTRQEPCRPLPRQGGTWLGCFRCSLPQTFSNLTHETALSAAGASTSSVCLQLATRSGIFLCSLRRRGHTRSVMPPHSCRAKNMVCRARHRIFQIPLDVMLVNSRVVPHGLGNAQLCVVGWSGKPDGRHARLGCEPIDSSRA